MEKLGCSKNAFHLIKLFRFYNFNCWPTLCKFHPLLCAIASDTICDGITATVPHAHAICKRAVLVLFWKNLPLITSMLSDRLDMPRGENKINRTIPNQILEISFQN